MQATPLLSVQDLRTHFFTKEGVVRAVDGVSFEVHRGEVLGIVGESGCGKSVTARSVLRLIPEPPGRTVGGVVEFDGVNLLKLSQREMQGIRGDRISMIFQDPMVSLNPTMRVGRQIGEVLEIHRGLGPAAAQIRAAELLHSVKIPDASSRLKDYPHQFSGGMRQRAMIAMALACEPILLVADEPTTALDVTVQAQILDLLRSIRAEQETAIILITHDLGVVAELCDRVCVMYAGKIVEEASATALFDDPRHPYTQGLLASIPTPERRVDVLTPIPGQPPDLSREIVGCSFAPRCDRTMRSCVSKAPPFAPSGEERRSRCWLEEAARPAAEVATS